VFHPTEPYFYHNNEGTMDVCAYRYEESGRLEEIGAFGAILPENAGAKGIQEQQGLCIDCGGDYIYDVARGPEMVAVFRVIRETGALELIQNIKLDAIWPRGCALSPDGRFLLVTGLKSGNIVVLAVGKDGKLTNTGYTAAQPGAAYVTFFKP
jgi:6-phosphogluconolactonase (cycloisomerase 2 family)